jgi:hypothetical protein
MTSMAAKGPAVIHEGPVVARAHVGQEDLDGEEAHDARDHDAEETMWLLDAPSRAGTLCRAAPSVIGVASRKLNRAASSRTVAQEEGHADRGPGAGDAGNDRERLRAADEERVAQRDLAGGVSLSLGHGRAAWRSAKRSTVPTPAIVAAMRRGERKVVSANSSRARPAIPPGTEARARSQRSRPSPSNGRPANRPLNAAVMMRTQSLANA